MRVHFTRLLRLAFRTIKRYFWYCIRLILTNPRRVRKVLTIIVLMLFVAITLIAKLSSTKLADDIQSTRVQLQQLQDRLNETLPPERIELGQQDLSVDYLLEQTDSEQAPVATFDTPSRTLTALNLLPQTSFGYSAFSGLGTLRTDTTELLRYHHEVIASLQPTLEYNPRAEFADKTLNAEEIKLRIDNARKGLSSAADGLRAATSPTYLDPNKGGLLRSINELTRKLEAFDKDRELEAWYKAVEAEQKAIAANRQKFWAEHTSKLYEKISDLNQDFARMERSLRG